MEFNLADLWESVADVAGDRDAVVRGAQRVSFAALDERANRLAHALAARGIGRGDHVAIDLFNSVEYLEVMLAAFKLRAVPINVNYRYTPAELQYLLADADAAVCVVDRDLAPAVAAARPALPLLRDVIVVPDDYEPLLAAHDSTRGFPPRSADDLYFLYTGGTTGAPKGVMWRHEDLFFAALGGGGGGGTPVTRPEELAPRAASPGPRCHVACPLMHGTAHWMALTALFLGGTVVLSAERSFDPVATWREIAAQRSSYLVIVGDAFARPLLDALGACGDLDLDSLSVILSGGAMLSPALKAALLRALPAVIVIDGYGASETGGFGRSVTTAGNVPDPTQPGRFQVNDDAAVLGADLRPVAAGETGLLARRGHVPLGYYKDPETSARVFPERDGVRWAVPGDHAVRREDDEVILLGRGSGCITTGGEKVYPEEVEAAVKAHPSVADAVVVGVPDERLGEQIVAVIATRGAGPAPTLDDLQRALPDLARYKLPRRLVVVDAVQRLESGKPDYAWARQEARSPAAQRTSA